MSSIEEGAESTLKPTLKPIDKAGHYGNMSPAQEKLYADFEEKLTKEGALPDATLGDREQQTIVLSRYLRAREWSIENGSKMYLDSLKWKKEVDLAGMMEEAKQGKEVFEERKAVAEDGWKMYFHGTDRYNRPIFIQDLSYLKVNELFTHTTPDRIIRFFAFMLEGAVRKKYAICTEMTRNQAKEKGTTDPESLKKIIIDDNFMILNVEGLGMGTFWAVSGGSYYSCLESCGMMGAESIRARSLNQFKGQLQQLLGTLDANFPELSGRVQIINAPWLFSTIFSYIKGWLPVATVSKIGIAGVDFQKELFEYIDPSSLPESIGGTCQCSHPDGCAFSDKGPWEQSTPPTPPPPQPTTPTAQASQEVEGPN